MKKSEIIQRVMDKVNKALAEVPNYKELYNKIYPEGRNAAIDGVIGNASFSIQVKLNEKYPSIDVHISVVKYIGCGVKVEVSKTYFDLTRYATIEQINILNDLFNACSIINGG